MWTSSNQFKTNVNSEGRVVHLKIKYLDNNVEITSDDVLLSFKFDDSIIQNDTFIGSFIAKSVKFELALDTLNIVSINREIEVSEGLLVNGAFEYVPLGKYIVTDETIDKKTKIATVEALDFALKFDKQYMLTWVSNQTIQQLVESICAEAGVELGSTSWFKSNTVLPEEIFGYSTYRDVISKIAEATMTFAKIGRDNKLYFKSFTNTDFIIQNIFELTDGDVFGPVNQIVFKKGETSDDVLDKNQTSVDSFGINEIVINNNEVINSLDREAIIGDYLANYLNFQYQSLTIDYTGHPGIDTGDIVSFIDENNQIRQVFVCNNTFEHSSGWGGILEAQSLSKTISRGEYVNEYDKRLTNAEINVSKANAQISLIASEVNLIDDRVSTAESELVVQAGQIATKVEQSTFDALGSRVTTAESNITQNANAIATKVSTTDLNDALSNYSTIKQTADKVALEIGQIQIGGENIYSTNLTHTLPLGGNLIVGTQTDTFYGFVTAGPYSGEGIVRLNNIIDETRTYAISFEARSSVNTTALINLCDSADGKTINLTTNWQKYELLITLQPGDVLIGSRQWLDFRGLANGIEFKFQKIKLEKGNKPTQWSLPPNELKTAKYVFDGSYATFKNGGLRIQNNAGTTVFDADTNGNLRITGQITANTGKIGRFDINDSDLVYTSDLFDYPYDNSDIARLRLILAGLVTATPYELWVYDTNNSGTLTTTDLTQIRGIVDGSGSTTPKKIRSVIRLGTNSGSLTTQSVAQNGSMGPITTIRGDKVITNAIKLPQDTIIGGIVESGSNANGSYTKFSDGTMECRHRVNITPVANAPSFVQWDFPEPFLSGQTPNVQCTAVSSLIGSAVLGVSSSSSNNTKSDIYIYRTNTTTTGVDVVARGRWK